jgi:succinyl-CoA synthetase beta subunit
VQLLEHEGKRLLKRWGVPVPKGVLVTGQGDLAGALAELGGRAVLKIQTPVGKRGKAGGIKLVNSPAEAEVFFRRWYGALHSDYAVKSLLAEEPLDIAAEMYLSVTLNAREGNVLLVFCPSGGVDIEEIAAATPEKVAKIPLDTGAACDENYFRGLFLGLGCERRLLAGLANTAVGLFKGFLANDALLAEINPLVVLKDGSLMAADAKIEIDDSALFRQPELKAVAVAPDALEQEAKDIGVTYIKLDGGDVGIVASGAGLSMNTMDLVREAGLKPANFLETGGGITSELVRRSLHLVTRDPAVRAVIVNLYGGVNSLLEAAKGVVAGAREFDRPLPLVVKALGNQQQECWQLLEAADIPVIKSHRTEDAVAFLARQLEVR